MILVIGAILLVVALAVLLAVLLTYAVYQSSRKRIGYIALPERCVAAVIEALELSDTGVLYDLGCGDGRILAAASKKYPRLKAIGIEINPVVARITQWRWRSRPAVSIIRGDIMHADLTDATHVFTYLSNPQMAELKPKLTQELSAGTRLVSCDFPMPGKHPAKTIKIGEHNQLGQTLYVYDY